MGDEHDPKAPASSLHSNVEPGSLALKAKLGEASPVGPEGPESIAVFGACVSTAKPRVFVVLLPAASVARTRNVYSSSLSGAAGLWLAAPEQVP